MFTISDIASIANYYSPLITAIATVVLAIITAYYAWQNRKYVKLVEKERKERISREMIDKVYNPLKQQLKPFCEGVININPEGFVFKKLELQNPSLFYRIPTDLREELRSFSKLYDEFLEEWRKLMLVVDKIYREILPNFGISSEYLDQYRNEIISVGISFKDPSGRQFGFSLLHFIFKEDDLETLKEKTKFIRIAVYGQYFPITIEKMKELIKTIKDKLKDNEVFQKISKIRIKLENKAKYLINKVNGEIERLSKNL